MPQKYLELKYAKRAEHAFQCPKNLSKPQFGYDFTAKVESILEIM